MQARPYLERLAIASLDEAGCPSSEQLAAYSLGMLVGNEELSVAAHVRTCPLCTADVAALQPPQRRARLIAQLLPPIALVGRRSGSTDNRVRHYLAADLTIELTIAPPHGDTWRITGQLLRGGTGVVGQTVTIRSGRRQYQRQSDGDGFFTFDALSSGQYTLAVRDTTSTVQIRDIVLQPDSLA